MEPKLRVLIVDDEYYFRKLLINLIDWSALGFIVEEEADNGTQAFTLACRKHYDLIIADINMPGMTGLEFVEALRLSDVETKVIFITSYDIFEYAQSAVSLGASSYLLKPVDEDELTHALKEVRGELMQQIESSQYVTQLQQQLERTRPFLRDHFVRQLMQFEPQASPEALQDHAIFYDIPHNAYGYAAVIAKIDELNVRFSKEQERQLWRFAVKNILHETLAASVTYCAVIDGEDHKIAILVAFADQHQDTELLNICEKALTFIHERLHLHVTLALGQTYESLSGVHLSYSEAHYVLKNKFTAGGNQVIAYTQDKIGSEDAVFSLPLNRTEWMATIRNKDLETLTYKINELSKRLIEIKASKEVALFVLMECVSLGSAAILERGGTLPVGWLTDRHPLFRQMYAIETVSSLQLWLQLFFHDIVFSELNIQPVRGKGSDIVNKAIEYIGRHYFEESVTLQQTARNICVNPSYLSHMFKKETGKAFTEYLSDIRLDKAMELLREAAPEGLISFKIVDVAQKVGYSDPYYFSRCFKKKYGVVPSKMLQS